MFGVFHSIFRANYLTQSQRTITKMPEGTRIVYLVDSVYLVRCICLLEYGAFHQNNNSRAYIQKSERK